MGNTIICPHPNLTFQRVRGPKYKETRSEYGTFFCDECQMYCYRMRYLGFVYDGQWEEWIPSTTQETDDIGRMYVIPSITVCKHNNITNTTDHILQNGSETRWFSCKDCGLNCSRTRVIGNFLNGPWQKNEKK